MQRKGPKHLYTNKMVVQGSYKLLKGKVVEHLGYWVYKKMDYHKRSMILNRARARYWLAMGAVLSPKIQRWFNAFNMWCPPFVKWGKSTAPTYHLDDSKNFINGFKEHVQYKFGEQLANEAIEAKMNAQSARNLYFRRFKYREQLKNYLDDSDPEAFLESIIGQTKTESQSETIFERSMKYYHLKQFYEDVERHPKMIAPYKKELLYNKMNELAEEGLLTEEETIREKKEIHVSPKLDAVEKAMALDWEKRKEKARNLLSSMETLFNPLQKEEFIARCRARINISPRDFDDHMEAYLEQRADMSGPLTHLDVELFLKSQLASTLPQFEDDLEQELSWPGNNLNDMYLPSKISVTPEPDLTIYDPRDWYDLREQTTDQIHGYSDPTDRWYDLPLSEAKRYKRHADMEKEYAYPRKETLSNNQAEMMYRGMHGRDIGYMLRVNRRKRRDERTALKKEAEEYMKNQSQRRPVSRNRERGRDGDDDLADE